MALLNAQQSSFNPAQLQPADQPSLTPYGMGGENQEYIRQTPMKGPDDRIYIKQEVIGVDGQVRGAASFISKNPDGTTQRFQPNGDGTYTEGQFEKRSFKDAVFGDPKLMAFVGIAAGGALAGSAWGTGGAGGSMLGGGTGATPGVVAGGTMGTSGLGAATGTGLLGTMGGGGPQGNPAADELFDSERIGGPMGPGSPAPGGAAPDFWGKLGDWVTGGSGIDGLFDVLGGAGNLAKDAGSLALMYKMYEENKNNAKEWRTWMEQGTPDLGFYQGKLKQSYEDPGSILAGPEYAAAQSITHNKLQRSDAAGGRLANDFGRQSQLQDHAMGFIDDYRNNLGNMVGQQQQTRAGIGSGALENAQAADTDWMKNLMNWLNSQGSGGQQ